MEEEEGWERAAAVAPTSFGGGGKKGRKFGSLGGGGEGDAAKRAMGVKTPSMFCPQTGWGAPLPSLLLLSILFASRSAQSRLDRPPPLLPWKRQQRLRSWNHHLWAPQPSDRTNPGRTNVPLKRFFFSSSPSPSLSPQTQLRRFSRVEWGEGEGGSRFVGSSRRKVGDVGAKHTIGLRKKLRKKYGKVHFREDNCRKLSCKKMHSINIDAIHGIGSTGKAEQF